MAQVLINDTTLEALGDAIREKKGEDKYLYKYFDYIYEAGAVSIKFNIPNYISENDYITIEISDWPAGINGQMSLGYVNAGTQVINTSYYVCQKGFNQIIIPMNVINSYRQYPIKIGRYYTGTTIESLGDIKVYSNEIEDGPNPETNYTPLEMVDEINGLFNTLGQGNAFSLRRLTNPDTNNTSIVIPEFITTINSSPFRGMDCSEIILPSGLTTMTGNIFRDLVIHGKTITIPESVRLGSTWFVDVKLLEEVVLLAPYSGNIKQSGFIQTSPINKIWVQSKHYSDYKNNNWDMVKALHDMPLAQIYAEPQKTKKIDNWNSQLNINSYSGSIDIPLNLYFNNYQYSENVYIDNAFDEDRNNYIIEAYASDAASDTEFDSSVNVSVEDNIIHISGNLAVGNVFEYYIYSADGQTMYHNGQIRCVDFPQTYTITTTDWRTPAEVIVPPDGVNNMWESFSNHTVNSGIAKADITFIGYDKFVLYIYSDGESDYDHTIVGKLDETPSGTLWSSSVKTNKTVYAYTSGKQKQWQRVEFSGLNGSEHTIKVWYGKDTSGNTGADRGAFYVAEGECE